MIGNPADGRHLEAPEKMVGGRWIEEPQDESFDTTVENHRKVGRRL